MADQNILIIGSGFAAAVTVIHLIQAGIKPATITIVGPGALGAGNAYGCDDNDFRLNVRAALMWIWPEKRDDFGLWAKANITDDPEAVQNSGNFYRRRDFARYVKSCLDTVLADAGAPHNGITHHQQIVTGLGTADSGGWQASLDDGRLITADHVILATGNPTPQWPCRVNHAVMASPATAKLLVQNPWDGRWLDHVTSGSRIAIIGSGLTALDAITALARRNHQAQIYLLAPHGNLPPVQADWVKQGPPIWPKPPRPSKILRRFRSYLPDLPPEDSRWQAAFEELRIDINQQWAALNDDDRRRLMRRLGWLWSRYRYRAAPQTIAAATRLQQSGILDICHARLTAINPGDDTPLRLDLTGAAGEGRCLDVDYVINCTGAGQDPFLASLVTAGIGVADAFGKGLRVTADNQIIRPDGSASKNLLMIGPQMASSLGDVVAASEVSLAAIRVAGNFAEQLVGRGKRHDGGIDA